MALDTVGQYLGEARSLLQDANAPFRYSDIDIVSALNMGLLEARRLRPDLFIGRSTAVPSYSTAAEAVVLDQQYRVPLVWYVVGHINARDAEDAQDARAAAFMALFIKKLLGGA